MAKATNNYYGPIIGFIFTFNLIVGTGALALPKAFSITGWLLGIVSLLSIAFFSYICATYVIETIALANVNILKINEKKEQISHDDYEAEKEPLFNHEGCNTNQSDDNMYCIKQKIELGEMASLFLGKSGKILFYICLTLYLYGDLCIYSVAISQTLTDISCTTRNSTTNSSNDYLKQCYLFSKPIHKINLFRIYLIIFSIGITPFVFQNIQKTRYLQIFTTFARWFAFVSMIGLCISRLIYQAKEPTEPTLSPPIWNFKHMPSLFGVAVYAFMCHHSIPSLISPLILKRVTICNIFRRSYSNLTPSTILLTPAIIFGGTYLLVSLFYVTLSTLAVFAFPHSDSILDLFTLNFIAPAMGQLSMAQRMIGYFLALFPALALATTFPILAVTLRNNLMDLMSSLPSCRNSANSSLPTNESTGRGQSLSKWFRGDQQSNLGPAVLLCLIPPFIVAWFVPNNLHMLVGLTGAFPGIAIQCLFPVVLVYRARRLVLRQSLDDLTQHNPETSGSNRPYDPYNMNPYTSPFKSNGWLVVTLLWVVVCVTMVAFHLLRDVKV